MIRRVPLPAVLAVAALAAAGCGGGGDSQPKAAATSTPTPTPTPSPTPAPDSTPAPEPRPAGGEREVIDGWARTLARSDEDGAARFFAPPVIVSQGPTQRLATPEAVRAFNASLPCGARLVDTDRERGYLIATFRLKDRPGHSCDSPGAKAAVAFRFRDGRISEWRRVPVPGESSAPPADAETA